MIDHAYDAVVVGAGPAGLSCGVAIAAQGGRCVVIEQGNANRKRDRHAPAEILSGVGGAGLFSDGKHSFFPAATDLWTLPDRDALVRAYDSTAKLLRNHGVTAPELPSSADSRGIDDESKGEGEAEGEAEAWHLKKYPSIYASLDQRQRCIDDLFEGCGERPWLGARVIGGRRDEKNELLVLEVLDHDGERRTIEARNVVIATGRLSPRFVRPWICALGARYRFRRLEFGVRVEMDARAALFTTMLEGYVDPKLSVDLGGGANALTFCTCRDGEVVVGSVEGLHALSGRADGPKTGRSSIGVLVRVTDPALAERIEPFLFRGTSPSSMPLENAAAGELEAFFGPEGTALVERGIARFIDAFMPSPDEQKNIVVHAPCVEGVGAYPESDEHLEIAPSIFVAGDASGRFRGIVASLVSGRYVAERILMSRRLIAAPRG